MELKLRNEVVLVPVEKLIPYENNAKTHPQDQVEKIVSQILLAGWDQPIVLDRDFVIIKGHGRRLAALMMGLVEVPCIFSDVSAEVARAVRLGDNKSAESPWDEIKLASELKIIEGQLATIKDTGFNRLEFERIMRLKVVSETTHWGSGMEQVDETEANTDGILAAVKFLVPAEQVPKFISTMKEFLLTTEFAGVQLG